MIGGSLHSRRPARGRARRCPEWHPGEEGVRAESEEGETDNPREHHLGGAVCVLWR